MRENLILKGFDIGCPGIENVSIWDENLGVK
jgi:hypothetical protein